MSQHDAIEPAAESVSSETVRRRLREHDLALPTPWQLPAGVKIPASFVRVVGTRAFVSGHVPIAPDGSIADRAGRVGEGIDLPTAQQAAVEALLGVIASVERAVGDLERVRAWCRLWGMVNAANGFVDFPAVFNPASQLLVDLFGEAIGTHARVAVGLTGLPWNAPVEIEAELELHPATG
jgi:enamine deaminase RidA (YjgF/YER057c/UK114 family)